MVSEKLSDASLTCIKRADSILPMFQHYKMQIYVCCPEVRVERRQQLIHGSAVNSSSVKMLSNISQYFFCENSAITIDI